MEEQKDVVEAEETVKPNGAKKRKNFGRLVVATYEGGEFAVVSGDEDEFAATADAVRWAKEQLLADGETTEVNVAILRIVRKFSLKRELRPTVVVEDA